MPSPSLSSPRPAKSPALSISVLTPWPAVSTKEATLLKPDSRPTCLPVLRMNLPTRVEPSMTTSPAKSAPCLTALPVMSRAASAACPVKRTLPSISWPFARSFLTTADISPRVSRNAPIASEPKSNTFLPAEAKRLTVASGRFSKAFRTGSGFDFSYAAFSRRAST